MVLLKKTKKSYHEINCMRCHKIVAENKTGICLECRTSICECGKRYTKQLHKYKPESKCADCRRGRKKVAVVTVKDVESFLEPGFNGIYEVFKNESS